MIWKFVIVLGLGTSLTTVVTGTSSFLFETALQANLTSSYDTEVLPNTTLDVTVELGLLHINDVNMHDESLKADAFLMTVWQDDRLIWNPSDYNNLTTTKMKLSNIWAPPITMANSISGIKMINDDSDLASMYVMVEYSGTVNWLSPLNVETHCSMDVKYYPFDSQKCTIFISSWMFSSDEINLVADTSQGLNLDMYMKSGEWELLTGSIKMHIRTLHDIPMPSVGFSIEIKRKYSYYLLHMVMPVILLTLIGPLVFLLPLECGETVGFSLTILLSLSVLITIVADLIPPSSDSICLLSVYLLVAYTLSTLQSVLVVILLRLYNKTNQGKTPGPKSQSMCRFLERVLCYRRPKKDIETKITPYEGKKSDNVKEDTFLEEPKVVYTYEQLANLIVVASFYVFFIVITLFTSICFIILTGGQ